MNCQETRTLLDAYVDGELDAASDLRIEAHLAACPNCARALLEQRTLATALHAASLRYATPAGLRESLRGALEAEIAVPTPPVEPIPDPDASRRRTLAPAWLEAAASWLRRPWPSLPSPGLAFALAGVFLLGVLAGNLGLPSRPVAGSGIPDRLAREVIANHVRSLLAGGSHLADVASSDRHTVKPWFEGKLDFSPPVSDHTAQGFPLVGGRLDYLDARPVAALIYRRDKHTINVFLWPTMGATGEESGSPTIPKDAPQGYHLRHWQQAGMNWWVVSDLNPEELQRFIGLLQSPGSNGSPSAG